MRTRCTNCRDYFEKGTEWWGNNVQRICSEGCFNEYTEARRQKAKNRKPKTYSKKRLQRTLQPELRHEIIARDKNCRVCGRRGHEVHHIQFRSQGGKNEKSNLILLCNDCHHNKAHSDQAKVYAQLFRAYIWLRYTTGKDWHWERIVAECADFVDVPYEWNAEKVACV